MPMRRYVKGCTTALYGNILKNFAAATAVIQLGEIFSRYLNVQSVFKRMRGARKQAGEVDQFKGVVRISNINWSGELPAFLFPFPFCWRMIIVAKTVRADAEAARKVVRRGEEGQSQSFWFSVVAVTGILIAAIILAWATYRWAKSRAQRRQQRASNLLELTRSLAVAATSPSTEKVAAVDDLNSMESARAIVMVEPPGTTEAVTTTSEEREEESSSSGSLPRRNKSRNDKGNNEPCKASVLVSIGRKSVASVQWVSLRRSMDIRPPQGRQQLQVVNFDERA
ncbi:hypothetical protein BX666DRAFT_1262369 [Dichotomocladium elegans]|nr:hypothetical protein BX666DRAFT_1262369 [Dichotomocladium elegans]